MSEIMDNTVSIPDAIFHVNTSERYHYPILESKRSQNRCISLKLQGRRPGLFNSACNVRYFGHGDLGGAYRSPILGKVRRIRSKDYL